MEATAAQTESKPYKFVTHHYPDTDAYAGLWAAVRFLAEANGRPYEISFVRAGENLAEGEGEGYEVVTFDTGGGKLDQHGKLFDRISSFRLFCAEYGLKEDPGIKPILELTVATDNVEEIDPTSIHYVLKGLAFDYKDPATKLIDWQACLNFAFKMFDIICSQAREQAKSSEDFKRLGKMTTLDNGIKLATIWHHPRLRQAAFDAGADVVMWTQDLKGERKGSFYPGIQVHRKSSVTLEEVIGGLRLAEAEKRGISGAGQDVFAVGNNKFFAGWFLHDSKRLVACGTRGHELELDECTKLSEFEVLNILKRRLGKIRSKDVRR